MGRSVEDLFDGFAVKYREVHTSNVSKLGFDSYYISEYKIRLLAEAGLKNVRRILDVGCGDGGMCLFFKKYFPNAYIIGIDISGESIRIARERNLSDCEFYHADGLDMPFGDETFDLVVVSGVLMHVKLHLQQPFLTEVTRVMAPGGSIAIFEHNPLNPVTRRLVDNCPFDEQAVLNSATKVRTMLQKLGYANFQNRYYFFFPRVWGLHRLTPLEKKLKWLPLGGQYFFLGKKEQTTPTNAKPEYEFQEKKNSWQLAL